MKKRLILIISLIVLIIIGVGTFLYLNKDDVLNNSDNKTSTTSTTTVNNSDNKTSTTNSSNTTTTTTKVTLYRRYKGIKTCKQGTIEYNQTTKLTLYTDNTYEFIDQTNCDEEEIITGTYKINSDNIVLSFEGCTLIYDLCNSITLTKTSNGYSYSKMSNPLELE